MISANSIFKFELSTIGNLLKDSIRGYEKHMEGRYVAIRNTSYKYVDFMACMDRGCDNLSTTDNRQQTSRRKFESGKETLVLQHE